MPTDYASQDFLNKQSVRSLYRPLPGCLRYERKIPIEVDRYGWKATYLFDFHVEDKNGKREVMVERTIQKIISLHQAETFWDFCPRDLQNDLDKEMIEFWDENAAYEKSVTA